MAEIKEIVELIDMLLSDVTVPRNIKRALKEARDKLTSDDELVVRISSAIYSLEKISEDVNMPNHARTQIWTLLSALESVKERE